MILEEENIMVENKNTIFVFSIDYINNRLYVSIFSKEKNKTIVSDYEIRNRNTIKEIYKNVNLESGSIFRKSNVRFIVRNHDKMGYVKNGQRRKSGINHTSINSVYDTRNTASVPILSRIVPFLKEAWLQI